jgi:hypothetical protein
MPNSNPLFTDAERKTAIAQGLAAIAAVQDTIADSIEAAENARQTERAVEETAQEWPGES